MSPGSEKQPNRKSQSRIDEEVLSEADAIEFEADDSHEKAEPSRSGNQHPANQENSRNLTKAWDVAEQATDCDCDNQRRDQGIDRQAGIRSPQAGPQLPEAPPAGAPRQSRSRPRPEVPCDRRAETPRARQKMLLSRTTFDVCLSIQIRRPGPDVEASADSRPARVGDHTHVRRPSKTPDYAATLPRARSLSIPSMPDSGNGKLVLVTGGGGFIGGHLVAQLLQQGNRVRAVDCKPIAESASGLRRRRQSRPGQRLSARCLLRGL